MKIAPDLTSLHPPIAYARIALTMNT